MAGSQVVLHRKDNASLENKNETRNLGLQSIVDRENTIVAQLISDASKQSQVAAQIAFDVQRMNSIMASLTWAANAIYNIINDAYMATPEKTQKFVDIQQGAMNQI